MLAQARTDAIFTSINTFRSQLQKIIDAYDPSQNPNAAQQLTDDQKKALMGISIKNHDILETLKAEGHIDDATYNTLKTQEYQKRPNEYKRAFATQLRKQFTYAYMKGLDIAKDTSAGIQ
jgi:hypothetical protein